MMRRVNNDPGRRTGPFETTLESGDDTMNDKTAFLPMARLVLLALLTALLALPAGATSLTSSDGLHPDGYALPGLRPAGYPNFETGVSVHWQQTGKAGYLLHAWSTGRDSNLLNMTPDLGYNVTNSSYQLHARFDAGGNLVRGGIKITGSVPDLGVQGGVLMTALLGEFSFTDHLLGFNTTDIYCPWFDFCTQNESVYISLADSFSMDMKRLQTTGLAVTTVPLPAAAWLLGGGLLGLAGIARRRRVPAQT